MLKENESDAFLAYLIGLQETVIAFFGNERRLEEVFADWTDVKLRSNAFKTYVPSSYQVCDVYTG